MRILFIVLFFFILQSCGKPKTVLICGDHVCINKAEAEQYFEENLILEVKILDKKNKNQLNLIELNLEKSSNMNRKISIEEKDKTNEDLKVLSSNEIKKIKKEIQQKNKVKKVTKKIINEKIEISTKSKDSKKEIKNEAVNKVIEKNEVLKNINTNQIKKDKIIEFKKKNINKDRNEVVDVCTIIEKCSIEEISKYLLEQGKKKKFPDLTTKK